MDQTGLSVSLVVWLAVLAGTLFGGSVGLSFAMGRVVGRLGRIADALERLADIHEEDEHGLPRLEDDDAFPH